MSLNPERFAKKYEHVFYKIKNKLFTIFTYTNY